MKAGNFLDALFAEFSVQPGSGHHSRVSVITYAAGASLIGDLEKFDNDGLDNVLPYLNASSSNVVNIQSALKMVENVSDKQGQYPRRRPVVVVVGTAISQDTSHDAVHAANALKAARFEIITIAYNEQEIPDTAQPVGLLASPGFSFSSVTNVNELVGLLTSALCQGG
ncbi:hypothetical protein AAVH_11101 [Aphelenchoides avenae]|nr:hypothetical protein AAVH_11101 [Aphelenchus avenae]